MTTETLQKKTDNDLLKDLKSKREDLRKFRFGFSGGKNRDTKDAKNLRKDIARIETELNVRKNK